MNYERVTIEKDQERTILIGMITNTDFLKKIRPLYKPELLTLPYAKAVASWCIEYYDKYDKAPFKDIKAVFESKKPQIRIQEHLEMIDIFLSGLNDDYISSDFNTDPEIDRAIRYFKGISIDNLVERLRGYRIIEDYNQAEAQIAKYKRIENNFGTGVDVLNDPEGARESLIKREIDSVLEFPGELGKFLRPITAKDFVGFVGPAKRGKSFLLLEAAYLTFLNQKNVLFISLEMPVDEVRMRLMQRMFGKLEPNSGLEGMEISIPMFDKNYDITKKLYHIKENRKCIESCDIINVFGELNKFVRNKRFIIESFPTGGLNVANGIIPLLDNYEHYDNFIPEAIFIDYCDIMAPEPSSSGETRHKINDNWLAVRGLGQELNIPVFTVSHTNKNTFDRDIRQSDMSEDNRKLNHLTLSIAINQSEDEMDEGLARLSIIADRFRRFSKLSECHITQCLDIGMPVLDSRVVKKKELK